MRSVRYFFLVASAAIILSLGQFAHAQEGKNISLKGQWEFQLQGSDEWQAVSVPGTFQAHLGGVPYDGVATYRKTLDPVGIPRSHRPFLRFEGVATHATVWFNDVKVGEHLGGWTPFEFDVWEEAQKRKEGPWEIRVEVDERVGHNTQGFLPVFAPHFGGIWKDVSLQVRPKVCLDRSELYVVGDPQTGDLLVQGRFINWLPRFQLHMEITVDPDKTNKQFTAVYNQVEKLRSEHDMEIDEDGRFRLRLPMEAISYWSPENPDLYSAVFSISVLDFDVFFNEKIQRRFAWRRIRAKNDQILLNSRPLVVRGVLNWGYAPPRNAPSLDEDFMRNEIQFAKDRGFNLMKFCLWVPPKRYLELCDEMGMLAWVEYPTWHPDFSPAKLEELKQEYDEFFFYDRNHPSVILRSLTCETGPSADINVIQALYDQCKSRIPDAIVEDDSSWIEWNRVHDFYDDHPYGNNHTWVDKLDHLKQYIAERETKPLILGEAIAADTWFDPDRSHELLEDDEVFWMPRFLGDSRRWIKEAEQKYGKAAVDNLVDDSLQYAWLMRKYQIETFHREVPDGGYVVSVIRDFPFASMGLIDFWEQPKWPEHEWNWHGDTMLLLETADDHRSFEGPQKRSDSIKMKLHLKLREGMDYPLMRLEIEADHTLAGRHKIDPGIRADGQFETFEFEMKAPFNYYPERYGIKAKLISGRDIIAENGWSVWVMPKANFRLSTKMDPRSNEPVEEVEALYVHDSSKALQTELECQIWEQQEQSDPPGHPVIVVTHQIDNDLLDFLDDGGNVVLLANGKPASFPLTSHWFLRGGPIINSRVELFDRQDILPREGRGLKKLPRDMFVELQHFDLAGDVIPNIQYMDFINPLVMLWENHDLHEVRTNGLLFHMPVGEKGNLFVSALNHFDSDNAAGKYVLARLIQIVFEGWATEGLPELSTGPQALARFKRELNAKKVQLESRQWRFQADGKESTGKEKGWHQKDFDDSNWSTITADRHWESQGHDTLDYWAWYRLRVKLPDDWNSETMYLNFNGVDDYYDLYVNGQKMGSGGNIEEKQTAFEERKSHDISQFSKAGETIQIAIAVYDWYGAGGIFRPVSISTQPLSNEPKFLK